MNKVIVIVGPTGVGKTKLSIELAKRFNGEIINGDSVQVYKGLDIGSAKIKEEEKEGIIHHLIDIKDISENYTIYDFQKDARECIEKINSKGKVAIICGGSGLYLKSCLYDYNFSEENEYNEYKELSNEEVYKLLIKLDRKEASKLHPNNRRRVVRALNIINNSNESKSELLDKQEHKLLYDCVFIGLTSDRDIIYKRINDRVDMMINNGLLKEVKELYDLYKNNNYKSLLAIGYKELFAYFNNEIEYEEAIELIKKKSRNYAKRQYTWFNNQFKTNWFEVDFDCFDNTVNKISDFLLSF